jgi:hypothetical protein
MSLITLSSSLRKDARVGSVRCVYIVVVAILSWPRSTCTSRSASPFVGAPCSQLDLAPRYRHRKCAVSSVSPVCRHCLYLSMRSPAFAWRSINGAEAPAIVHTSSVDVRCMTRRPSMAIVHHESNTIEIPRTGLRVPKMRAMSTAGACSGSDHPPASISQRRWRSACTGDLLLYMVGLFSSWQIQAWHEVIFAEVATQRP